METQNINLPACRLGEIRRFGYASISAAEHDFMLNWSLDLTVEHNRIAG